MPYKGISVGLFFSCFEKIGKHHEPRKRTTYAADGTSGRTRGGAIPSLQRGAACNRSGSAKRSARPDIHSSLRVRTRAIPSLSYSGYPNAALSRHALRHALWRLSTTWLHRTSAQPAPHGANGKCQRPTIARATVFRQHGKQPRAAGRSPGSPRLPYWIPATTDRLSPTSVSAVRRNSKPTRYAASGGAALPPNDAATGFGCPPGRAAFRALLCGAGNV